MIVAWVVAAALAQPVAPPPPPEPWPAELAPAFALYYAGDWAGTQRACREIASGDEDAVVRREAAALAALATIHQPGRDNRLEGRSRLVQLARENPELLGRPECRLAFGIAATALHETSTAILNLRLAAAGFEQQHRPDRLGEALVALAEAWALHSEWEFNPPGVKIEHPDNPADAERIRRHHLDTLRARAAKLPRGEEYAARIDLVRAAYLLGRGGDRAKGLALLQDVAARRLPPAIGGRAALRLGACYEQDRRWNDAVRLYGRVAAAGVGELSREAAKRTRDILQPQLELGVTAPPAGSDVVYVDLSVRNLDHVTIELRGVDLRRWLEQRKGRFAESALPTDGVLLEAREVETRVRSPHDWWRTSPPGHGLALPMPDRPTVVLARGTDREGKTHTARRLLMPGGLRAEMLIGPRRAVLWVVDRDNPLDLGSPAAARAWFWIAGAFVPRRITLEGSVGVFALPPEARLMRDKRWVCLVQVGPRLALCRGRLPVASGQSKPSPAVVLLAGSPKVHPGGTVKVCGVLLSAGAPPVRWGGQHVTLRLIGAASRAYATKDVVVSPAGTFTAEFPVGSAALGDHLRVLASWGGRRLEGVVRRPEVICESDADPLVVRCVVPARVPTGNRAVMGRIEAFGSWGRSLAGASGRVAWNAVGLPANDKADYQWTVPVSGHLKLDDDGGYAFVQPLGDFHLSAPSLAIRTDAVVLGWDQRPHSATCATIAGPDPVFLRLLIQPAAPRAGDPVTVGVEWFDPQDLAGGAMPTVTVARAGQPPAELPMLPAVFGLRSAPWRPGARGRYEIVATLPLRGAPPRVVRRVLDVGPVPGGEPDGVALRSLDAHLIVDPPAKGAGVVLGLDGEADTPLLAVAEDGDPLAAVEISALAGRRRVRIPLSGDRRPRRVLLLSAREGALRVVGVARIEQGGERSIAIRLAAGQPVGPGLTLPVRVDFGGGAPPPDGTVVLLRLADQGGATTMPWVPGDPAALERQLPGGIVPFGDQGGNAPPAGRRCAPRAIPETCRLSPEQARAWFGGVTRWLGSARFENGQAAFEVPLPQETERLTLIAVAQTPGGDFFSAEYPLDLSAGVSLALDAPPRLLVGDRAVVALRLENAEAAPVPVVVDLQGGAELSIESVRALDPGISCHRQSDGTIDLTLAARSRVTLLVDVEATRVGTGRVVCDLRGPTGIRRASRDTRVTDEPELPATADGAAVTVRRTLWLLRAVPADQADASASPNAQPSRPEPERIALIPGDRILPGQRVLIEETIVARRTLRDVVWRQSTPANCCTLPGDARSPALARLGYSTSGETTDAFAFGRKVLRGKTRVPHEYVVVATRPGVCRLPRPEVTAGGENIAVSVEPADVRIRVGR